MKISLSTSGNTQLRWLVIVAGAGLLALIWFQVQSISRLEQEAKARHSQRPEVIRVPVAVPAPAPEARAENPELAELRARLSALEDRNRELEKLAEERRKKAAQGTNTVVAVDPPDVEVGNYFAREAWTNAGFATPTATIETMFWAVREGNFERLLDTMSDADAKGFSSRFKNDGDIDLFWQMIRRSPIGRLPGYFVVDVEVLSDNRRIIYLNSLAGESAGLDPSPMGLTKYSLAGWKLDDSSY